MARCSPDDGLPDHLYFGPADEEWRTDDTPLDAEGNEIAQMAKGYDVRKIFTRSVDSKGHSDKVQVKMVSSQVSLISKWVEDRRTKYRSNQDFIRDAVYHRLHQMNEIYGEGQPVTTDVRVELLIAQMETEELDDQRIDDALKMASKRLAKQIADKRWERVLEIISELETMSKDWPASTKQQAEALIVTGRDALRKAVTG